MSTSQNVQNGERSGVRKETDQNLPERLRLNNQKDRKDQESDTTTQNKKAHDSAKGKVESVDQHHCGSGNKTYITATEDNAEEMCVNMESGSTGTDEMEIDSSSEISQHCISKKSVIF